MTAAVKTYGCFWIIAIFAVSLVTPYSPAGNEMMSLARIVFTGAGAGLEQCSNRILQHCCDWCFFVTWTWNGVHGILDIEFGICPPQERLKSNPMTAHSCRGIELSC